MNSRYSNVTLADRLERAASLGDRAALIRTALFVAGELRARPGPLEQKVSSSDSLLPDPGAPLAYECIHEPPRNPCPKCTSMYERAAEEVQQVLSKLMAEIAAEIVFQEHSEELFEVSRD